MAVQQPDVNAEDLTDADRQMIDVLQEGARTKGAIEDETGLHRNTVGNRLDVLEAGDVVERIHDRTALYELVDDPREGEKIQDEVALLESLQEQVSEVTAERDQLQADLEDCRDQLAEAEVERNALEEQHAGRAAPPERLQEAAAAIERGLDRLPADAPGRTPLEDAQAILEEVTDDGE